MWKKCLLWRWRVVKMKYCENEKLEYIWVNLSHFANTCSFNEIILQVWAAVRIYYHLQKYEIFFVNQLLNLWVSNLFYIYFIYLLCCVAYRTIWQFFLFSIAIVSKFHILSQLLSIVFVDWWNKLWFSFEFINCDLVSNS